MLMMRDINGPDDPHYGLILSCIDIGPWRMMIRVDVLPDTPAREVALERYREQQPDKIYVPNYRAC